MLPSLLVSSVSAVARVAGSRHDWDAAQDMPVGPADAWPYVPLRDHGYGPQFAGRRRSFRRCIASCPHIARCRRTTRDDDAIVGI